jgi:hypothetical protein
MLLGTLQGTAVDVTRHGVADDSLADKIYGKIGVIGSNVNASSALCQIRNGGKQTGIGTNDSGHGDSPLKTMYI